MSDNLAQVASRRHRHKLETEDTTLAQTDTKVQVAAKETVAAAVPSEPVKEQET